MKSCSRCKNSKEISEFSKDRSTKDGLAMYCKSCTSEYRKNNRLSIRKAQQRYYRKHKDRCREKRSAAYKKRYDSDLSFRLSVQLRNRLRRAIDIDQKRGSAVSDLGCSISELKKHLERQFYPHPETGQPMTWDNWGRGTDKWNIDHILEFNQVDLSDREQLKKVVHYTNLQPLWQIDNIVKSHKVRK